ncbi:alpha/beta hydrolase family protein [Leucobacter sp. UCMA 4100]|uniref:alpha/beta hydrolase family protein n=1 Tax=Leucobacter sp. UCMA 4100 TaxID=2810534 RepID=UPI0022EA869B|nr:alpha/beta hydrolase [Leucobacter sp. UCMA 4100]
MTKKKLSYVLVPLLSLVVVAAILMAAALIGNSFRFTQRAVTISGPDGALNGVLTLPRDEAARGLVVMVHGDGPVEATQGGLYSPWFEGAADAGFATLSWSKPGIDGSEGDWLSQSMSDRAEEVSAVIDWAKAHNDVPSEMIVLWGASQAGWVLPKVVAERNDIDGVVAVGTAINWLRQGRFNLLAELDHEGATAEERERAIRESDQTLDLLERQATYDEYLIVDDGAEPMEEARWGFVLQNFESDATDDLVDAADRSIPWHLMVGTQDRNVDVSETEQVYRSIFGSSLTVSQANGAHSLARTVVEDNGFIGLVTGVFWPRALLAPEVIDDYGSFLSRLAQH